MPPGEEPTVADDDDDEETVTYNLNVQWNLSYLNPLGLEVVHKSENSVSLKLCINNIKIA